jgi:transcriptional regulator with XRE-family HTH domain
LKLVVEIDLNEDYVTQLKRRMDEAGVSQNALAKEIGLTPSQVSRWFTQGERRVDMLVPTALLIERALLSIQRKLRQKKARK